MLFTVITVLVVAGVILLFVFLPNQEGANRFNTMQNRGRGPASWAERDTLVKDTEEKPKQ